MQTLGLNYSQAHDSSACIVRDGELLFAVAEERISRLKHDARFTGILSFTPNADEWKVMLQSPCLQSKPVLQRTVTLKQGILWRVNRKSR